MDDKDIDNVHAWRMIQKGNAGAEDQKLAFKIHKALLSEEGRKKYSITTARNLLLDLLIEREKIPKTKAYKIVGIVENVSGVDTIRKDYNAWEKLDQSEQKAAAKRYYSNKSNFTDLEESKKKLDKLNEAIKKVMGDSA